LHRNFDEEIVKMTSEFKQKLLEQRESFSPHKMAEKTELVDTLQNENKALKKKLQLCSTELTKCFKALEAYKTKLKECEKYFGELVAERDDIAEKFARLQNSARERSNTHSRGGSNSRNNLEMEKRVSSG
jgi:uncharacterized coiled-coil DUF342 family protein